MNLGLFLVSALWILSPSATPAQSPPQSPSTLRETFIVAAETVIDDAAAVDIKADDAHFDGQMHSLNEAEANLTAMADDDLEKDIAAGMKDMIFQIASCHIQSKDGAPTDKCESQINNVRHRAMETINKHKSDGVWADGPPA